jgi:hypothetical protein
MLNQDIVREATRLTRLGQLTEATALLQRMLRGENTRAALQTWQRRPRSGTRAADHRRQGNHGGHENSAARATRQQISLPERTN